MAYDRYPSKQCPESRSQGLPPGGGMVCRDLRLLRPDRGGIGPAERAYRPRLHRPDGRAGRPVSDRLGRPSTAVLPSPQGGPHGRFLCPDRAALSGLSENLDGPESLHGGRHGPVRRAGGSGRVPPALRPRPGRQAVRRTHRYLRRRVHPPLLSGPLGPSEGKGGTERADLIR